MATVEQPKKATKGKVSPDRWEDWTRYLAKRSKPIPLAKLIAIKQAKPLLWSLPGECQGSVTEDLLNRLQSLAFRKPSDASEIAADLEQWLESARVREISASFALEALAWCNALPSLANLLPAAPWSQLLDQLVGVASDAAKAESTSPLPHQLLAGELPLTLAYLLPELAACKTLAEPARDALSHGLTEFLDGEGMPHAKHLSIARPLLACWTRCLYMGRTMKRNCFTKDAKTQYEWLIRQSLRLLRNDGTQVFSADFPSSPSLIDAALTLVEDKDDDEIADSMLPGRRATSDRRDSLPSPATNSEWAELAVLRREWDRSSDQLMVSYANREVQVELNCGKETVFSGLCNPELRIDGKLLELQQDWEEVCWYSDKDLDYLEIESRFENGWKVQRQFTLAREERFLVIADAIMGESVAQIDHRFTLPLREGVSFLAAGETREGILHVRKPVAAVLPLQLPEWRADRVDGALEQTASGLQLRQSANAKCLMAPLFLDLKPKRFSKQLTWRRLTVAQQLQILPADVAVGYRIQCGKRQWLIYRSLGPTASRSVLGQHFSSEYVMAQFPDGGELKQLIEIE
ncbi:MAG: hypothetical protein H6822_17030 [Planctomycetaceae bacterium]|nr:hypothetical protein [Planctomycetales bacterium]MCB9923889.1 hypothetical protein [Planctomycetaceae bacterium]